MIPLCDVQQQNESLLDEISAAMQEVAASGQYILGPNVKAFEQEIADYCGCKYAVGVGSGTDALQLSLRALNIGPGDEVITTPFTFVATTEAIGLVGATPVFVDIDPYTFNIDVQQIDRAMTPRTKAILPVHLYGQPCDMSAIMDIARQREVNVVEDCAQAMGASYQNQAVGTFGSAGCLSFFPSKNLGCLGDGGMIVTNDRDLYERAEMLRRHGGKIKYHHAELGLNSRLDEIHAAVLRVKLKHLDHWNGLRRQHAYRYNRLLEGSACQLPRELTQHGHHLPKAETSNPTLHAVYHQYTLLTDDRDLRLKWLQKKGISCFPYYPQPLHLQEVHQNLGHRVGDFPISENVARQCLSLPMFPELSPPQQDQVGECLFAFVQGRSHTESQLKHMEVGG